MLNADTYIDRLRQTVKDVKSLKNNGKGVSFDAKTRLNYLLNRCDDLVKDYDEDFDKALEHYGSGLSSTMRRNEIKTSS